MIPDEIVRRLLRVEEGTQALRGHLSARRELLAGLEQTIRTEGSGPGGGKFAPPSEPIHVCGSYRLPRRDWQFRQIAEATGEILYSGVADFTTATSGGYEWYVWTTPCFLPFAGAASYRAVFRVVALQTGCVVPQGARATNTSGVCPAPPAIPSPSGVGTHYSYQESPFRLRYRYQIFPGVSNWSITEFT